MEMWKVINRVYKRLDDEGARFFSFAPGYEYIWTNETLIDLDDTVTLGEYLLQHHFVDPTKEDLEEVIYSVCRDGRRIAKEIVPPSLCIQGIVPPKIRRNAKKKQSEKAYQWIKVILENYVLT